MRISDWSSDVCSSDLSEFKIPDDADVEYPPKNSYRYLSSLTQLYANSNFGLRSLQDFKKISIVEVKGYCYGWHFYQAADADLVISADDALFGHSAFRYVGWAARMRSEEHTSELQSLMRISYAVFCLKKKKKTISKKLNQIERI